MQDYKRRLREAAKKTPVYLDILGDEKLTEDEKRVLGDYMQEISNDRLSRVYKTFKEKQTRKNP